MNQTIENQTGFSKPYLQIIDLPLFVVQVFQREVNQTGLCIKVVDLNAEHFRNYIMNDRILIQTLHEKSRTKSMY